MKKHMKNLIVLVLLTICTLVFAPSAFALGESTNLTVKVVIDNAADYPSQVAGLTAKYNAQRILKMAYSSSTANRPTISSTKTFNVVDNSSTTLSYAAQSGANCDTYWFSSNTFTDKHLSLESVTYTADDNLKAYTYTPTGTMPNTYATQPFNWVEVIDSTKPASVTLHFKYNPDIGGISPDPDPAPSYSKTIDYLGDGGTNPDTTDKGVNDYRLSLSLLTQEASAENKADIIFVLDVSGSMGETLTSGQKKIDLLKSTMTSAVNTLTTNPYNRVSIIKFSNGSQVLVSNSSDKATLTSAIASLSANGCTNYYASLNDAIGQVNLMTANDTENRDKVVIFLTDGEPTFATPAAVSSSTNNYAGMIYACESARKVNNVDKFYSIFIGENSGSASTLQTITQMTTVSQEKYMVQATNAEQLTNTLNRFMSKMSNTLFNVTITDGLSDYVTYTGGMIVTKTYAGNPAVVLTAGVDYTVSGGTTSPSVTFIKPLGADSKYTLSFNVRSNDFALNQYLLLKGVYPAVGDAGTDSAGNTTSSGQNGFYSNSTATLKYCFGTTGTAEKAYNKPVVQVVPPQPVTAKIELTKKLEGDMALEADMFNFTVTQVTKDGDVLLGEVTHDEFGVIQLDALNAMMTFSEPGAYAFKIQEVVPAVVQLGMDYDEEVYNVLVTVENKADALVITVSYPQGQTIVNKYAPKPVEVELKATKVLKNKALVGNDFEFDLYAGASKVETIKNDAWGNINFTKFFLYSKGTYTYTIIEKDTNILGIEYDATPITVSILVEDVGGQLTANITYSKTVFTNKYTPPMVEDTIIAEKILTGMKLSDNLFTFRLTGTDLKKPIEVGNKADGSISFPMKWEAPGTYSYIIEELIPDSTTKNSKYETKYMTYSEDTIEVTVIVSADATTGKLSIQKIEYQKIPKDPTAAQIPGDVTFYNSYQVRGVIS